MYKRFTVKQRMLSNIQARLKQQVLFKQKYILLVEMYSKINSTIHINIIDLYINRHKYNHYFHPIPPHSAPPLSPPPPPISL